MENLKRTILDYKKSHQRCGEILYQATLVEQEMDSFLTAYFTEKPKFVKNQKVIDLFSFIAEIPFDKKKKEVARILKLHEKNHKNVITNIELVQINRNIVAHRYRSLQPGQLFKNRRPLYYLDEQTITIDDKLVKAVFEAALKTREVLASYENKFSNNSRQ